MHEICLWFGRIGGEYRVNYRLGVKWSLTGSSIKETQHLRTTCQMVGGSWYCGSSKATRSWRVTGDLVGSSKKQLHSLKLLDRCWIGGIVMDWSSCVFRIPQVKMSYQKPFSGEWGLGRKPKKDEAEGWPRTNHFNVRTQGRDECRNQKAVMTKILTMHHEKVLVKLYILYCIFNTLLRNGIILQSGI